MSARTRGWLLAVALLAGLFLAAGSFLLTRGPGLRTRVGQIRAGMTRAEVEGMLGRPALVLKRAGRPGESVVWVDQLWQVDIVTDGAGRVESVGCVPSDSAYRRTVGRVLSYP
jgi:hypothetical protein